MRNGIQTKEMSRAQILTKEMGRPQLKTKEMSRAKLSTKEMRGAAPIGARPPRSAAPCAYTPTHPAYGQMVGWSHYDGLTRALVTASNCIKGFKEDDVVSYIPSRLDEYIVEAPDFDTIDEDGLAAHIRKLEDAIKNLKNSMIMPMLHARNAETDYKLVSQAIESITDRDALAAIMTAYSDALHYAKESAEAYSNAEERLLSQLEEAKSHVRTPIDIEHDIEELRKQVAELMEK